MDRFLVANDFASYMDAQVQPSLLSLHRMQMWQMLRASFCATTEHAALSHT